MEGSELIRMRRSIRKYRNEQIPRDALEKIIEAGLYAPNAGGRQGTLIVAVHDRALAEKIGRMNLGKFDRSRLLGSFVSKARSTTRPSETVSTARRPFVPFLPRNIFYSAFRTHFAQPKTWSCRRPISASRPASYRAGRRRSTAKKVRRFFGNGRSRKAILHGVSLRSAIATAPTRSRKRGKKADG